MEEPFGELALDAGLELHLNSHFFHVDQYSTSKASKGAWDTTSNSPLVSHKQNLTSEVPSHAKNKTIKEKDRAP